MWARVVEFMLACWLAISPFIFAHAEKSLLWINDFACALIIATVSMLSFVVPKAHLVNLAVAAWLVIAAFVFGDTPPIPARQNHIVLGLVLLMFAVIPSRASMPPRQWG